MSVMTTGKRAGLTRVTALPRPRPDDEARHQVTRPQVTAFRQVSGHRQIREFRQVAEVRYAREVRVIRAAAGAQAGAVGRPTAGTPGRAA